VIALTQGFCRRLSSPLFDERLYSRPVIMLGSPLLFSSRRAGRFFLSLSPPDLERIFWNYGISGNVAYIAY